MQNELPEWAKEMAEQVAKEATRDAMRDPLMPYYITVAPHIAHALVAAERRGIERAAKVALTRSPDDDNLDWQVRQQVATAIRQIGETT